MSRGRLISLFIERQWTKPFTYSSSVKAKGAQGGLVYFDREEDFLSLDVGLSECEALSAWTGSVLVSSALPGGRRINVE